MTQSQRLQPPPLFMGYPAVRQRAVYLHRNLARSGMTVTLAHLQYPGVNGTRVYSCIYVEALLRHPNVPDRITLDVVRRFNASPDGRDATSKSQAEWSWWINLYASQAPVGLLTLQQAQQVMGVNDSTLMYWRKNHPSIVRVYEGRPYIVAAAFEALFTWHC